MSAPNDNIESKRRDGFDFREVIVTLFVERSAEFIGAL